MNMRCRAVLCGGAAAVWLIVAAPVAAQQSQQQPNQQQNQNRKAEKAKDKQGQQQVQTTADRIELEEIEENPGKFMGRKVTVQGEVDAVLGPRVFKIDERNWGDLDGEILVVMSAPLAALVDENEPVIVTGTLRPFVKTELEREWGFLGLNPEIELDLKDKPVLVASSLVSAEGNMILGVATAPAGTPQPTGTAGTKGGKSRGDMDSAVTDVRTLAEADDTAMVGRRANLTSVKIQAMDDDGGFWVTGPGDGRLYVLPAGDKGQVNAKVGQTVSIEGYVLRMPEQLEQKLEDNPKVGNEEIYVYALTVK
jgi:hypothetical protein